jgi:hypothetical protein
VHARRLGVSRLRLSPATAPHSALHTPHCCDGGAGYVASAPSPRLNFESRNVFRNPPCDDIAAAVIHEPKVRSVQPPARVAAAP